MIKIVINSSEQIASTLVEQIKKHKGIGTIVLFSKSFEVLSKMLKEEKVDFSNLLFIDTVGLKESAQVITSSQKNLTALSISISEVLQSIKGESFIIFDSILPLLIYNDKNIVTKFILFTLRQLQQLGEDTTIILPSENVPEDLVSLLKQSADKVETWA